MTERLRLAEMQIERRDEAEEDRSRLREELAALRAARQSDAERLAWIHTADEQLRDRFRAIAGETVDRGADRLAALSRSQVREVVDPLSADLARLREEVRGLETAREGAYAGLRREIGLLRDAHGALNTSAADLASALRAPAVRGRWGEVQLRRVVEMAGLIEHVDFVEQPTTGDGQRPDLVVHLPGDAILPIDAKAPLQAFLALAEATGDAARETRLGEHVRAVRARIAELGQRAYWQAFERAPDFVVMFLPNDAALAAAFAHDPELLDFALGHRVLPASPVTLLALLKTIALGWQQRRVAENAQSLVALGETLAARLRRFLEHQQRLGKSLDAAVATFNQGVGSLERRVLPAARKLQAAGAQREAPPEIEPVERRSRSIDLE